MTRKHFLHSALEVGAATLGLTLLSACEAGDPSTPAPGDPARPDAPPGRLRCITNGTRVAIAENHGHVLLVTRDDVAAGQHRTYDIRGTGTHGHTVTLTQAHFAVLAEDQAIVVVSSRDEAHSHSIMIACI